MGLAWMVTALMVASTPFRGRWFFGLTGIRSSSSKVSQPSITFPNTVYLGEKNDWRVHQNFKSAHLRSKDGCGAYVRNHWLPLEFGPELAIESTPLVLCFKSSLISSWYEFGFKQYKSGEDLIQTWNFPPHMLSPPFPVFVGSPVCTMKPCRGDIVKILKWIQDPPRFNFITLMFLVNMQLL